MRILAWFLALISGLRRCLFSWKPRRAAADRGQEFPRVSVESSASVDAGSVAGAFYGHEAQPATLSTGSVCFMPAAEANAPTPCSMRSLPLTSLSKQSFATTDTPPPAVTPAILRPALGDITKQLNREAPTPATVAGSVGSCCPSPVDEFMTPEAQPMSASRYIINTCKQVVGVANTARRYTEDRPLPAHNTPYPLRLDKELENTNKVEGRLATSRETREQQ